MPIKKNEQSSALDRRQFVKGAMASTAAIGMLPVATACAITRDKNGRIIEWICVIAVVQKSLTYWIYKMRNCTTGQEWNFADVPGLPTGNCGAPAAPACVERDIWDKYERVTRDGKELVVSPKLAEQWRIGR